MTNASGDGTELFFSYSHRDRDLRDELERHLSLLKRSGDVSTWHDREIGAGTEWEGEIHEHLERARIILLLISADFLSSDYIYDVELRRAMECHAAGTARVIPVILRSVDWAGAPFNNLQAVPTGGKPVTSWTNRDEAFTDVARAIRRAIADLKSESGPLGPASSTESRSWYPTAQCRLIEDMARSFVGREDAFRAFRRFQETAPRGYFIVEGAPGHGKSALASKLVTENQLVHHFVGKTNGPSDSRLILGSLLAQLATVARVAEHRLRPIDELRDLFEHELQRKAAEQGRVFVVIDALNEIPSGADDEFPFLPLDGLPVGVYFFLTSQPDERLDSWKEQLAGVPYEVFALAPLGDSDGRKMIERLQADASERVIVSILGAARGSPLYVRAALESVNRDVHFNLTELPESIEGYFRRATRDVAEEPLLRDVLGLLAVCRRGLSLHELSEITGVPQRRIHNEGIQRVRQFLTHTDHYYGLYHQRFHDFVSRDLFFGDELRQYHRMVAEWLNDSASEALSYRWTSLSYHLYHAHDSARLLARIDEQFLRSKLERFGYGVLEDLELIARSLLHTGDSKVVVRCARLLDGLRSVVGDAPIDDLANRVRPRHAIGMPIPAAMVPDLSSTPGLQIHAMMIPRRGVTADFIEVARRSDRLIVAIGDAPSSGLKSAFVARFIATAFGELVRDAKSVSVGHVLGEVNRLLFDHEYFERVSMQCVEIAPTVGTIAIASAGHPYPVLYAARRGSCDILEVRGPLLHDATSPTGKHTTYEERHAEIQQGDLLILVTDGLTEGGRLDGNAYGYRFTGIVEQCSRLDAKSVCEAILADWRRHERDDDSIDDVAVVVVAVTEVK